MKVNMHRVLAVAIILFCISSLTYAFWPPINRVLALFIIAALVSCFLTNIRQKDVIIGLGLIGVLIFSVVMAEDMAQNLEDWLYWAVTCVFLAMLTRADFVKKLNASIKSQRVIVCLIIWTANIVLSIGFFIPSCYAGGYYIGFSYSQHVLSCGCCILLALVLFYFKGRTASVKQLLSMLPATLAILSGGARTFIISIVVIWFLFFLDFVKNARTRLVAVPVFLVVAIVLFLDSGMMQKFLITTDNIYISENTLTAMSSGRLEFWNLDIMAFLDADMLKKLLGHGFDYVYRLNYLEYGLAIWAHNDIINLLICAGLLGTAIYISVFSSFLRCVFKKIDQKKRGIACVLYVMLPMLLNGLFLYQHYLYSVVILYLYLTEPDQMCKTDIVETKKINENQAR